ADDVVKSALLAHKKKTSVYDMLYAVIAKRLGTDLITADDQFVRKTKFSHVKLLSEYA
ncbi:PIN domain-containing protein, partial [Candidatus Gottesmanbacteria bacterium]|nr:PIN domain-containing protein [Candidatus Gottesmanbacteria bacterium]